MKRQNRLTTSSQTQETQLSAQQTGQESVREFASAEDMLRHDAMHTPVPPAIAHRLKESMNRSSSSSSSWWKRLFGS